MNGDAPTNPIKIMVGYEYNSDKDIAFEIINRPTKIIIRNSSGVKTFEADIDINGKVKGLII